MNHMQVMELVIRALKKENGYGEIHPIIIRGCNGTRADVIMPNGDEFRLAVVKNNLKVTT